VLHRALQRAVEAETLARNVASIIPPPKVDEEEIDILKPDEVATVLQRLDGHVLYPLVFTALATGMRRGEFLALRLDDCNLDGGELKIERSLEETKQGLRFKPPKTKHGRRTISLPASVVAVLRVLRLQQLELRMALGLGKPDSETLVFSAPDGSPLSPDNLSRDWRRAVTAFDLPRVMFHALRHTHASALIAAGVDVAMISRRLGHGSPVVTLKIYAHLFAKTDRAAATAIDAALRTTRER
jgi:integrase